jgi:S-adenosyl-L-methionine hydrolase (adenosine-forming)
MTDPPPLLAFLTDYGRTDPYVGLCHAAVAAEAPEVRVVDLVHDVDAQDIVQGAVLLHDCVPFLPGAVLLAVVDPGVGTDRLALALRAGGRWLVGPDNGLLVPAAERLGGVAEAWALRRVRPGPARTFDGRDVFAPAAARLARGVPPGELGTWLDPAAVVPLTLPRARTAAGALEAEVLRRDGFGNLLLSGVAADLTALGWEPGARGLLDAPAGRLPVAVATTFADVPRDALALLPDAFGRLQLAAREADAGARLGFGVGSPVRMVLRGAPGEQPVPG